MQIFSFLTKKMGLYCLLVFLTVSSTARAQEKRFFQYTAKQRISAKIEAVETNLSSYDSHQNLEDRITALDGSGIREHLTDLQNLIRVYEEMDYCKQFKPFYEEAKAFEDLISHVRDFKYFYQSADQADQETKAKYKKILDAETVKYGQFFETSSWFKSKEMSFRSQMMKAVDLVNWPSAEVERDDALNVLAKRLQKIQDKQYDLNEVELGIHELKRDIRRFSYLRRGYSNLVIEDDNSCPLAEENREQKSPVIDKGAYTCPVSSCLTNRLVNASNALDSIKMSGLEYELRGVKAPQWVHDQAQVIHDNIKNPKILVLLSQQLKSCRQGGFHE